MLESNCCIFNLKVILLVYWLTLVCRKNPTTGEPLYKSPVFMSPWISFFYIMNLALNTGIHLLQNSEKFEFNVNVENPGV